MVATALTQLDCMGLQSGQFLFDVDSMILLKNTKTLYFTLTISIIQQLGLYLGHFASLSICSPTAVCCKMAADGRCGRESH